MTAVSDDQLDWLFYIDKNRGVLQHKIDTYLKARAQLLVFRVHRGGGLEDLAYLDDMQQVRIYWRL
ncbi:MAG: hypothetical protein ACRDOO_12925 [Actinomadura sp.]